MSKPNILMMVMDDQRSDSIAAFGNPHIQTPTLDRLVNEGTTFTRAFTTEPICTPARAELLTGCHVFHNDVKWFGIPIREGLTLLPQALQDAGYHTVHCGKWHNDGRPADRGFVKERRVFPEDNLNNYHQCGNRFRINENGNDISGNCTELIVDAALEELASMPAEQPWFTYLALMSPHDPFDAPEPFASMYSAEHMPLPDNYMPEHPFDIGDLTIRDELLEPWPREQANIRDYRARYYSNISHHDHHLGRVIDHLENTGQLDNTLIIFTSDHGLAVGSHGLLGKENMYDHSIGVPLIMRGPSVGIKRGQCVNTMAHHVDLLPTVCDVASTAVPASATDGQSLLPLAQGDGQQLRDALLFAFCSPDPLDFHGALRDTQRAVRTDRWKLSYFPGANRYQLFDLENDPHEMHDLLCAWRYRTGVWGPDTWARKPTYERLTPEAVDETAQGLWRRMLSLQSNVDDPAVAVVEANPPPSVVAMV